MLLFGKWKMMHGFLRLAAVDFLLLHGQPVSGLRMPRFYNQISE